MTACSHKHKFIYFRTPKTASTSVEAALMALDPTAIDNITVKKHPTFAFFSNKWSIVRTKLLAAFASKKALSNGLDIEGLKLRRLISVAYIEEIFPETPDDYFKFTNIRNSWDRLVSNFIYYSSGQGGEFGTNEWQKYMGGRTCFKDFIRNMREEDKKCEHLRDQSLWAKDMDYTIRFDALQGGFDIACDKIGLPRYTLGHKLKSRTSKKHYTEYYEDDMVDIVRDLYAEDIERFGFEFGE